MVRKGAFARWLYRGQRPNRLARILKAYLQRAPGARAHVPVDRDAPMAEFEPIAGAFPVFRIAAP
jgi:hypothetical protein